MKRRPVHRVAVVGLDRRDVRLIDIVFRHAQYNRHEFVLLEPPELVTADILIVDAAHPEGERALVELRAGGRKVPTIGAVARGVQTDAIHSISIERLTVQLLPILNRVVEIERCGPRPDPATTPAAATLAAAVERPRPWFGGSERRGSGIGCVEAGNPSVPDPLAAGGNPGGMDGNMSASGPDTLPAALAAPAPGGPRTGMSAPGGAEPQYGPAAGPGSPARWRRSGQQVIPFPGNAGRIEESRRLRVLIVDESANVRQQLMSVFDRFGLCGEAVASGEQALRRLAERHFDLMTLDIGLPGIDGLTVLRALREASRWRQLPVVVLSTRASPIDRARGLLAGADVYLAKPVEMADLYRIVTAELRRSLKVEDLSEWLRPSGQVSGERLASA